MAKIEVIGWRAYYPGGTAHYWKTRRPVGVAASACGITMDKTRLTDKTNGQHCVYCEGMLIIRGEQ